MVDENLTFEKAYKRLKEIYEYLYSNEVVDIDEMIKLQQEAENLYKFCKAKLLKINSKLKNDNI
jgi:exodeoxyribonuclease VII small subunit